jgi:hypothetical protein
MTVTANTTPTPIEEALKVSPRLAQVLSVALESLAGW